MKTRFLAAALAPLLLAACSTASVRAPAATPPAAFEAPPGQTDAAVLDAWWTQFDDPALTGLIETALGQSADIKAAFARLEEARAVRRASLYEVYTPTGDLRGSARRTETDQTTDPAIDVPGFLFSGASENYALNFDVSWELDLFGARRAARRALDAEFAASRFNYEGVRASLAANVAQSYFEARGLAIQLEDARQTQRLQQELYSVAVKRVAAGLAPGSEADQSAASAAQSQAEAVRLEAELQVARRLLLILVGRPFEPTTALPVDTALAAPPPVPATVPGELLTRRPEVREAERRIVSAAAQLRADKVALFPHFNITPGAGLTRSEVPGLTTKTATWYLGGTLLVPILDRPRLLAQIEVSDARGEQAVVAYERAVQTAFGEAETTLVRLNADNNRVRVLTAGEARARNAYDAARKRYDLGLGDITDAITAETNWRAARSALTAAQIQALTRSVQAFKALGGGWSAAAVAADPKTMPPVPTFDAATPAA